MKVSVVMPTRNRAASLRRALASVRAASIPPSLAWEFIVVDNGSSDDTPAVIESFKPDLPMRYVSEPQPGVSHARNACVAAAQADHIVWIDDDVEVEPGWLASYLDAFAREPGAAIFGGKILPVLEPPIPDWLAANYALFFDAFAGRDFGDLPIKFTAQEGPIPFGANMAALTAYHRKCPFDPSVGAGTGVSGGEETKVIRQMLATGAYGIWVPGSVVRHHIPSSRMTTAYIEKFNYETALLLQREQPQEGARLFGVPRWMLRNLAESYIRYRIARATRPVEDWVRALAKYAFARGQVAYWREERAGS